MRPTLHLVALALLPALLSCQTQVPSTASESAGAMPSRQAPMERPAQASAYRIREDLSDVRFLVYRAGPLARLGHNHVIQARKLQGEILRAPALHASSLRLTLAVEGFEVDNAQARREEGADFSTEPDQDAVAGTRRNMLGEKVLDVARYPEIVVESTTITGPAWQPDVGLRIRLHGVEREFTVPVALEFHEDRLTATASFPVRQSDFGITPLSVLGGGLQVADTLRVRLRLVAIKEASK